MSPKIDLENGATNQSGMQELGVVEVWFLITLVLEFVDLPQWTARVRAMTVPDIWNEFTEVERIT
jgi:hypothetical protein